MTTDPKSPAPLRIDHEEPFPHFENAPIVEAIIQINTRVLSPWEEGSIVNRLRVLSKEYPRLQTLNKTRMTVEMQDPAAAAAAGQPIRDLPPGPALDPFPIPRTLESAWAGARLTSEDGKRTAIFTQDSFVLSRLAPYDNWRGLAAEAERLWEIFADIGAIEEVTRISSRFINRLEVPLQGLDITDYFEGFGSSPGGFEVGAFLHHMVLLVPGTPYQVNLIRTHQPATAEVLPLILDLEAFSTEQSSRRSANISERFKDLRWVKNKVFFSSIAESFKKACS